MTIFSLKSTGKKQQSVDPAFDKQFKCLFQTNSFAFDQRCNLPHRSTWKGVGVSVTRDVLPTIFENFLKESDLRFAFYTWKHWNMTLNISVKKTAKPRVTGKLWNFCAKPITSVCLYRPHSLLLVVPRCQQCVGNVESAKEMILALNSQTNGRKQHRYKTFRGSCNPVPPKHSFRRHFKAILKPNSAGQRRIYKRQFHSGSARIRACVLLVWTKWQSSLWNGKRQHD